MTEQTATYELTTRGRFKRLLDAGDEAALQLAAEALEWLADEQDTVVVDERGDSYCVFCLSWLDHDAHEDDCPHERAKALLPGDRAGYAAEGS